MKLFAFHIKSRYYSYESTRVYMQNIYITPNKVELVWLLRVYIRYQIYWNQYCATT